MIHITFIREKERFLGSKYLIASYVYIVHKEIL